jgi:hypothetical protein
MKKKSHKSGISEDNSEGAEESKPSIAIGMTFSLGSLTVNSLPLAKAVTVEVIIATIKIMASNFFTTSAPPIFIKLAVAVISLRFNFLF